MTTANAIKKISKDEQFVNLTIDGNHHYFDMGNQYIEFYSQEGSVVVIRLRRKNDNDDPYSDYSAGIF